MKMIYKIHCPICQRTYILCMAKYSDGRLHIDGTYCEHSLDTVKNLVMGDTYE